MASSCPLLSSAVRLALRVAGACIALALAGTVRQVEAQQNSGVVELRGRVFLAGDTVSLGGALIEVPQSGVSAVAARDGRYRLLGLRSGTHELRVRLIGLSSRTLSVDLTAPGVHFHDIAMSRLPNTLAEVRINGRMHWVPPRFDDVYRRMHSQWGTFFLREEIVKLNPVDVLSLIARVPTARVNDRGVTFAKCVNGGSKIGQTGMVQIYIDGHRKTGRGGGADIGKDQLEVLSRVPPSQIQAIEVYTGVSRIPGEFLDDACGVIAIWTR